MAKPKSSENKAKDVEGVKMELNIKNRLLLTTSLLPREGNIINLTLARDIRQKVELTQAEIKKYGVKPNESGGLKWDEKGWMKKVQFTNAEIELLKTQVNNLDKQQKINSELLDLCLKIRG